MLNCYILLVFVCASFVRADIQCTRWLDRCSCQTDHGIISLKSISSSNGTARQVNCFSYPNDQYAEDAKRGTQKPFRQTKDVVDFSFK